MKPIGLASGAQFAITRSVFLRRALPHDRKALLPPGPLSVPLRAEGHFLVLLKLLSLCRTATALQANSIEYHILKSLSGSMDVGIRSTVSLLPEQSFWVALVFGFSGCFFGAFNIYGTRMAQLTLSSAVCQDTR